MTRRRWRYRADGTSYEVPIERAAGPAAAIFIGDQTAARRAAARGQVPVQEAMNIAKDHAANREHEWRKQRPERIAALVDAAKRHSNWE
jgi:hypothetical protein